MATVARVLVSPTGWTTVVPGLCSLVPPRSGTGTEGAGVAFAAAAPTPRSPLTQLNMRRGQMPEPEDDGLFFLRIAIETT